MDAETEWNNMISFWFDRDPNDWFEPPEGLDDYIRTRYLDSINQARAGALDHWRKTPKGVLCLVLLLDQWPRNMFRGTADQFSSDLQAQQLVIDAIARGWDKKLGETSKLQQLVIYIPLVHAENILSQIAVGAFIDNLINSCEPGSNDTLFIEKIGPFLKSHKDVVLELGRFPKRNAAMGRQSTADEVQYLKEHP